MAPTPKIVTLAEAHIMAFPKFKRLVLLFLCKVLLFFASAFPSWFRPFAVIYAVTFWDSIGAHAYESWPKSLGHMVPKCFACYAMVKSKFRSKDTALWQTCLSCFVRAFLGFLSDNLSLSHIWQVTYFL